MAPKLLGDTDEEGEMKRVCDFLSKMTTSLKKNEVKAKD